MKGVSKMLREIDQSLAASAQLKTKLAVDRAIKFFTPATFCSDQSCDCRNWNDDTFGNLNFHVHTLGGTRNRGCTILPRIYETTTDESVWCDVEDDDYDWSDVEYQEPPDQTGVWWRGGWGTGEEV